MGPRQLRSFTNTPYADDSLGKSLALSRRVSAVLAPILSQTPIGIDFSNVANVRVTEKAIVLYLRSPWQKTKLRQLLPRLDAAAQAAGFVLPVTLVVRPEEKPRKEPQFVRIARSPAPQAARSIEEKTDSIVEPALREAMLRLAKTLRGETR